MECSCEVHVRTGELHVRTSEVHVRTGDLHVRTAEDQIRTAEDQIRTSEDRIRTSEDGVRTAEFRVAPRTFMFSALFLTPSPQKTRNDKLLTTKERANTGFLPHEMGLFVRASTVDVR